MMGTTNLTAAEHAQRASCLVENVEARLKAMADLDDMKRLELIASGGAKQFNMEVETSLELALTHALTSLALQGVPAGLLEPTGDTRARRRRDPWGYTGVSLVVRRLAGLLLAMIVLLALAGLTLHLLGVPTVWILLAWVWEATIAFVAVAVWWVPAMRRRLPFVLSPILFLWFAGVAFASGAYFTGGMAFAGAIVLAAIARWAW